MQTEAWSQDEEAALGPYMRALGNFGRRFQDRSVVLSALTHFGEPVYTDDFLVVWKLRD